MSPVTIIWRSAVTAKSPPPPPLYLNAPTHFFWSGHNEHTGTQKQSVNAEFDAFTLRLLWLWTHSSVEVQNPSCNLRWFHTCVTSGPWSKEDEELCEGAYVHKTHSNQHIAHATLMTSCFPHMNGQHCYLTINECVCVLRTVITGQNHQFGSWAADMNLILTLFICDLLWPPRGSCLVTDKNKTSLGNVVCGLCAPSFQSRKKVRTWFTDPCHLPYICGIKKPFDHCQYWSAFW